MKYNIELNEKHIKFIALTLEQYSRMICGQLDTNYIPALEHILHKFYDHDEYMHKRKLINDHLFEIKKLIFDDLPRNANHGIGFDDNSDLCYEMYKEILFTFEQERQEKCEKEGKPYHGNVHTSKSIKLTDVPRMNIKYKSKRQLKIEKILD